MAKKSNLPPAFQKAAAAKKKGSGGVPPALKQGGKMVPMNKKNSKPSPGVGDKSCPACIKAGSSSSCSHM